MSEFLARPQGKPSTIIDGIDLNHHVWIREQYLARQSRLGGRLDDGIIKQPLGLLRSQLVFCAAPAQSHVQ